MSADAKRPSQKRRVEAYAQGDLDYLCAIYAIINALRALCPEITDDVSTQLFRKLIRSLEKHTKQVLFPLILGTDSTLLRRLLVDSQTYLKRRFAIELAITLRGRELKACSLTDAWERLAEQLDTATVMIIQLNGCCNHWTVLYDVRPKKIRLIDSGYRRKLKRKGCTLGKTKKRYQLKLSSAIALSRGLAW